MNQNNNRKLTAYPLIVAATQGDIEAIHTILNSYAGYIAVLAMREVYDEYGNIHLCIDEVLRRRMETKLNTRILKFKV